MLIFFNCTATTEIYTLSLHDALPIFALEHCRRRNRPRSVSRQTPSSPRRRHSPRRRRPAHASTLARGTSSGQPGYAGRQGPSPAGALLPALLAFRDSGPALALRVSGVTTSFSVFP